MAKYGLKTKGGKKFRVKKPAFFQKWKGSHGDS
jgi:hypothetical protein